MTSRIVPAVLALAVLAACDAGRSTESKSTQVTPVGPTAEKQEPTEEFVVHDEAASQPAQTPEESRSAFDSVRWNSAVGLGGGAGGHFAGRDPRKFEALRDLMRARNEDYEHIDEHGWHHADADPLSTFAIDVDGASYGNLRRMLREGALPPPDAVRVEECVNWFHYEDAARPIDSEHDVAVQTEFAACPWQSDRRLLRVVLRARSIDPDDLPARNLVFLVDVSGSMEPENKLPLIKRALLLLAREMRETDSIAIVTYAGEARVALEPTTGRERDKIEAAIDALSAGGSTNGSSGIRLAYELAHRRAGKSTVDRVLLATDGDFNVGTTDRADLISLIERERDSGVYLTVLGVGSGNLKDATLEALGRHGNGLYAYLDSIAEARRMLIDDCASTLVTMAKDTKVQIEFNPRFVGAWRQIGYENRKLAARDFNDDLKDAGEMGAGHVVTALYEIVPSGGDLPRPEVDPLRYGTQTETGTPRDDEVARGELLTVKVRYQHRNGGASRLVMAHVAPDPIAAPGTDFRFAGAVAAFAMCLRGSPQVAGYELADVLAAARDAKGADPTGERAEFLQIVQMAIDLRATSASRSGAGQRER
ncbi:MAG: VWA domain-containing protein [Planctomycetota bacterium]